MKKQSSLKGNFIYNTIYQILILILPLITAPYVSRVIGAEGNGIYSYTYSVVQYFVLFAMLGLSNYGNRTIAKHRDNKEKLSTEFFSIYTMQLMTSGLMIVLYIGYITIFDNKYYTYALIQTIYLISTCFDITWFFYGLEKFKLTVTRNIVIRVLSAICIFVFVNDKDDLAIYTFLMVASSLISQISLWPFLRNEIKFIKPKFKDVVKHIKPNLVLFVPVIAVSIYKLMDKVMLGNMTNVEDVAYYDYAERIINIPTSIITALGTVMLPRISNLLEKGEKSQVRFYIDKSMEYMMFMSIPICFGLIIVAPEFVPIYLGNEYMTTGTIVQYLAVTLIFVSWANVIRTQYLIPKEKDKIYIVSVILGAIVNFVINIILIPKFQAIGSAIATIFAEFTVMLVQTIAVRKELEIKKYAICAAKFLITAIIMSGIILLIGNINIDNYLVIVVQIFVGMIIYFLLNYKFILNNIQYIPILNKFHAKKKEVN